MATYAIGDIQGCLTPLRKLLDKINFDASQDTVWFTGDLVNRGPQSLETLRFIKQLGSSQRTILGNHDLHLLAVAHGSHPGWKDDTFAEILAAPDRDELMLWLAHQPLLYHADGYTMVHAGMSSRWDLKTAIKLAHEVEAVIQSDKAHEFFKQMYGDTPVQWDDQLIGWERIRCITNYLTRVRFCHADGSLELHTKGKLDLRSADLIPWYDVPQRTNADLKIIFGHWAALGGKTDAPNTLALDTGCGWGYCLTAMRLSDQTRFCVDCA